VFRLCAGVLRAPWIEDVCGPPRFNLLFL